MLQIEEIKNTKSDRLFFNNNAKVKTMLTTEEKELVKLFSEIIVNKTLRDAAELGKKNADNDR